MEYLKELNHWFSQKLNIHTKFKRKFPKRGDVWIVNLGINIGSEQNEKRPCLVIWAPKNKYVHTCIVIPASRTIRDTSFIIDKYAFLLHQLRVIDTKRFGRKLTRLEKEEVNKLSNKLMSFFNKE